MNANDTVEWIKSQLSHCAGWMGDEIATQRQDAWNYYLQRARGDEVNGRSKVVAGTVSSMVEAVLSQVIAALESDNLVEIDPDGPDDEDQAQLESDAVSWFVMKQDPGFVNLAFAIKEALLLRNGVMKCWCDETERVSRETIEQAEPELLAMMPPNAEVTSYDAEKRELNVKLTERMTAFRSAAVSIDNFLYPREWDSFDVQRIPFCAERHVETRSELIKRGFPKSKVKNLTAYAGDSTADASRNPGQMNQANVVSLDPSQDRIEWYECYVLVDTDGDGIAERRRISMSYVDAELLEDVPVSIVPYPVGAALLIPNRLTGMSLYDKLRTQQDIETGLTRMSLDSMNTTIKNRIAYLDGKVNADDVGDGRTNGAIRVSASVMDVRTAVQAFTVPDQSVGVLAHLQHQRTVRNEMGGAALELASGEAQLGDKMGSQGLDRAYSVMEQLSAMMMQNIAATLIRSLFLLSHAVLREHYDKPVNFKRNGKWRSDVPSKWPVRKSLTVKLGKSAGQRARQSQALEKMIANQIVLAQMGQEDVLVGAPGYYRANMDWARINEIQNPEQYWIDPQSDQAVEAQQSKARMAEQERKKREALMTEAVSLERFRAMIDKYKSDQETQFKYFDAVLDSEVKEAEIAGKATVDLLKVREDGQKAASTAASRQQAAAGASE